MTTTAYHAERRRGGWFTPTVIDDEASGPWRNVAAVARAMFGQFHAAERADASAVSLPLDRTGAPVASYLVMPRPDVFTVERTNAAGETETWRALTGGNLTHQVRLGREYFVDWLDIPPDVREFFRAAGRGHDDD